MNHLKTIKYLEKLDVMKIVTHNSYCSPKVYIAQIYFIYTL